VEEDYGVGPMTVAELRALGHPLRLQILQMLLTEGPSTASELGRRLGESSGSTSYHLRALHKVGMVEEVEQANARERWWRRAPGKIMIPNSIAPEVEGKERTELQAAHAKIESIIIQRDEAAYQRWMGLRYDVPLEWQDAIFIGNLKVWTTADELKELLDGIFELTAPYRRPEDERPPDAREVFFTLRLLVQEGGPDDPQR
jgi:DNA-binding transcriptional ArsR family regulator